MPDVRGGQPVSASTSVPRKAEAPTNSYASKQHAEPQVKFSSLKHRLIPSERSRLHVGDKGKRKELADHARPQMSTEPSPTASTSSQNGSAPDRNKSPRTLSFRRGHGPSVPEVVIPLTSGRAPLPKPSSLSLTKARSGAAGPSSVRADRILSLNLTRDSRERAQPHFADERLESAANGVLSGTPARSSLPPRLKPTARKRMAQVASFTRLVSSDRKHASSSSTNAALTPSVVVVSSSRSWDKEPRLRSNSITSDDDGGGDDLEFGSASAAVNGVRAPPGNAPARPPPFKPSSSASDQPPLARVVLDVNASARASLNSNQIDSRGTEHTNRRTLRERKTQTSYYIPGLDEDFRYPNSPASHSSNVFATPVSEPVIYPLEQRMPRKVDRSKLVTPPPLETAMVDPYIITKNADGSESRTVRPIDSRDLWPLGFGSASSPEEGVSSAPDGALDPLPGIRSLPNDSTRLQGRGTAHAGATGPVACLRDLLPLMHSRSLQRTVVDQAIREAASPGPQLSLSADDGSEHEVLPSSQLLASPSKQAKHHLFSEVVWPPVPQRQALSEIIGLLTADERDEVERFENYVRRNRALMLREARMASKGVVRPAVTTPPPPRHARTRGAATASTVPVVTSPHDNGDNDGGGHPIGNRSVEENEGLEQISDVQRGKKRARSIIEISESPESEARGESKPDSTADSDDEPPRLPMSKDRQLERKRPRIALSSSNSEPETAVAEGASCGTEEKHGSLAETNASAPTALSAGLAVAASEKNALSESLGAASPLVDDPGSITPPSQSPAPGLRGLGQWYNVRSSPVRDQRKANDSGDIEMPEAAGGKGPSSPSANSTTKGPELLQGEEDQPSSNQPSGSTALCDAAAGLEGSSQPSKTNEWLGVSQWYTHKSKELVRQSKVDQFFAVKSKSKAVEQQGVANIGSGTAKNVEDAQERAAAEPKQSRESPLIVLASTPEKAVRDLSSDGLSLKEDQAVRASESLQSTERNELRSTDSPTPCNDRPGMDKGLAQQEGTNPLFFGTQSSTGSDVTASRQATPQSPPPRRNSTASDEAAVAEQLGLATEVASPLPSLPSLSHTRETSPSRPISWAPSSAVATPPSAASDSGSLDSVASPPRSPMATSALETTVDAAAPLKVPSLPVSRSSTDPRSSPFPAFQRPAKQPVSTLNQPLASSSRSSSEGPPPPFPIRISASPNTRLHDPRRTSPRRNTSQHTDHAVASTSSSQPAAPKRAARAKRAVLDDDDVDAEEDANGGRNGGSDAEDDEVDELASSSATGSAESEGEPYTIRNLDNWFVTGPSNSGGRGNSSGATINGTTGTRPLPPSQTVRLSGKDVEVLDLTLDDSD